MNFLLRTVHNSQTVLTLAAVIASQHRQSLTETSQCVTGLRKYKAETGECVTSFSKHKTRN